MMWMLGVIGVLVIDVFLVFELEEFIEDECILIVVVGVYFLGFFLNKDFVFCGVVFEVVFIISLNYCFYVFYLIGLVRKFGL